MLQMSKTAILLILLMCSTQLICAQIDWKTYSQSAPKGVMDKPSAIGIIVCIPMDNNSFWANNQNERYFNQLSKDKAFFNLHSKNIIALTTFDTANAHFFLHGVNKQNAGKYQFRVMEYPNRVIEPWLPLSRFTDPAVVKITGLPEMGYMGGYKAQLSNMLIVDVRKINDERIIATAIAAWVPIKPIVTNIYTSDTFDAFLQRLQYPWSNQASAPKGIPSNDLKRPAANANFIFFIKADIYHRKQLQYQLMGDGKIVIPWKDNDYDNSFVWLKENEPGKYQVNIRYAVQPQHVTSYRFEVEPPWYQSNAFKIATGIVFAALAGAFLFIVLLARQKKLTRLELSNKTKLQLELKAIHAQLNPHFVFNALSSIQGLINVHDIKGANIYLADFAKLMRESLKGGNKDEIPLKKEIEVLQTYLRLEQLRFGFHFKIVVANDINPYEVNLPSLLLQPLVENSIKHGIAGMRENGSIKLNFNKTADSLAVTIADNGIGFKLHSPTPGYGLKLTRNRIKLLNELNPQQTLNMQIQSEPGGTLITLTFNNWFL
jgi:two-component system LytT family sensor kinase